MMERAREREARPPAETPLDNRPDRPILTFVKKEWKWLLTSIPALLVAGGYLMLPASTATVEKVRAGAAGDLAIVKAEVSGQFQVVNSRIDELKEAGAETRADIKELLRRIPASPSHQVAASAPPAPLPAANPSRKKSKPKPQRQTGILSFLRTQ